MSRLALVLALLVLPAQVLADDVYCEEPWFIRNLIFDRAGYCFSTPLGQAIFDNSDCTGTDVALSPRDQDAVAQIREMERWLGCDMDTSRTTLATLPELDPLRRFALLPIPVDGASGCIGYLGPEMALLTAPGAFDGPVMGRVTRGSSIVFSYIPEGTWEFVTVYPDGWDAGGGVSGWVDMGGRMPECREYAG